MMGSYDEPVIFVIEAPDLESQGASDEVAHGEFVKARYLPPRLLIRLGGRTRAMVRQEEQQGCELNSCSLVRVKA
jgi:hypothetical protein